METAFENSLDHCEFETKYRIDDFSLIEFKQLVEQIPGDKTFVYVEGPDKFFTYPSSWFKANPQWDEAGTFARYRTPSYGLDNNRRQVTWKYKPKGALNNIKRKEHNWDVGNTPEKTILEQLQDSNTTFNFSIVKNCHLYKFIDATLVFYTVYDTTDGKPKKSDSFIEIEVCEETIGTLTVEQAFDVIKKYERHLSSLGISAQRRMDKSLFEIYRRWTK